MAQLRAEEEELMTELLQLEVFRKDLFKKFDITEDNYDSIYETDEEFRLTEDVYEEGRTNLVKLGFALLELDEILKSQQ